MPPAPPPPPPAPPSAPGPAPAPGGELGLEWWEVLGARLRRWRGLAVLRRLQVLAVWAALPLVAAAVVVVPSLRYSLGAWAGCLWVVVAWFWLARTKSVPWQLVSVVFAVSAPWAGVVAWVSSRLVEAADVSMRSVEAQVVAAPLVEELGKLVPLMVLAVVAPGRVRRLLVSDWLVLGVACGAGFMAMEEGARRLAYTEATGLVWTTMDRAFCSVTSGSNMMECMGATTFGLSPFSGESPAALSFGGHAVVTGLVAAATGVGRHLWWRSQHLKGTPRQAAALRAVSVVLPVLTWWVAVVDHAGRNASTENLTWANTKGEAPSLVVGITSTLTGGGAGRGWLLLAVLVAAAVLDARILWAGGYSTKLLEDVGVYDGAVGGGWLGVWRWRRMAALPPTRWGRWRADVVDALLLPLVEARLAWRALAAGKALGRHRLAARTVVGLRQARELAARGVADSGPGRWSVVALALVVSVVGVVVLAGVPSLAGGLRESLTAPGGVSLASVLDALGTWWESLSPLEQGLLMVALGAAVVATGGSLSLAFTAGTSLAMLDSAHTAADLARDPKGTVSSYLATHTPAEIAADTTLWLTTKALGGALGAAGGLLAHHAAQDLAEPRLWRNASLLDDLLPGHGLAPAYPHPAPDPRTLHRAHHSTHHTHTTGTAGTGGTRRARPQPPPSKRPGQGVNRGDGHDRYGLFARRNEGSHGYDHSEWQGREDFRRQMDQFGTPLREMVAERRVARVAGMRYDRYYDGFAQRQDGTWVGIEVKHGSSPYGGDQSAFDALVSPDKPAHATLPDGRTIKIIDVIYEEVPRQ
ncbi:hypothetical protein [Actinomyces wuliandei]|uniref:hypothetical protein n=1 Tax=Actinomyces wuliandei TaxID=2057743 RepID=UPI000FD850AA|nr:hypothetical protein [Actinomyces wuliandei]